jgi:putative endonuclease
MTEIFDTSAFVDQDGEAPTPFTDEETAPHLALGQKGEQVACQMLWRRGYRILQRNYRHDRGEIDIVAERRGRVHFVEVKTRSSDSMGPPEERVDSAKQDILRKTARAYLEEFHTAPPAGSQFDVVAQVLDDRGRPREQQFLEDVF